MESDIQQQPTRPATEYNSIYLGCDSNNYSNNLNISIMTKLDFFKADVKFKTDNKPIEFQVVHNLPEIQGLCFEAAVVNWLARTNKYTAKSLCEYIMEKDSVHICMTISQWKRLNKLT